MWGSPGRNSGSMLKKWMMTLGTSYEFCNKVMGVKKTKAGILCNAKHR